MRPVSINIVRRGDLSFTVHGPTHCGSNAFTVPVTIGGHTKAHMLSAHWAINATATPDSLDARGFLFDQAALDGLVHRTALAESYVSCEKLAHALADAFCRGVARENGACTLTRVVVTLSPTPYLSDISVTLSGASL